MALSPEFILRARWLMDGRYQIYLQDYSGNGKTDVVIGDYASDDFGHQCMYRDFRLSHLTLGEICAKTLQQLEEWGFGSRRGGMFTYETDPEKLQEAMDPYRDSAAPGDFEARPRPYHIHIAFFRKEFLGGGLVTPFSAVDKSPPLPPFRILGGDVHKQPDGDAPPNCSA
jgi:hypothetical protein